MYSKLLQEINPFLKRILSLDNLFSISEMYVHILNIVISQPIPIKKFLLFIVKKINKTIFHRRGKTILRNKEQMKNFSCSDNDSIYIFFHF